MTIKLDNQHDVYQIKTLSTQHQLTNVFLLRIYYHKTRNQSFLKKFIKQQPTSPMYCLIAALIQRNQVQFH